jgi:hypothetical protein
VQGSLHTLVETLGIGDYLEMPIDPEEVRAVGDGLVAQLVDAVDGYGTNAYLTSFVIVARVRSEPTEQYPADSGQTIVVPAPLSGVDDRTQSEYLIATLEDALQVVRQPRIDPDDLPSLD